MDATSRDVSIGSVAVTACPNRKQTTAMDTRDEYLLLPNDLRRRGYGDEEATVPFPNSFAQVSMVAGVPNGNLDRHIIGAVPHVDRQCVTRRSL